MLTQRILQGTGATNMSVFLRRNLESRALSCNRHDLIGHANWSWGEMVFCGTSLQSIQGNSYADCLPRLLRPSWKYCALTIRCEHTSISCFVGSPCADKHAPGKIFTIPLCFLKWRMLFIVSSPRRSPRELLKRARRHADNVSCDLSKSFCKQLSVDFLDHL